MPYKSLREAIELCDKTRVQKLLEDNRGFDINQISSSNIAPLFNIACRVGNLEIIKLLNSYGAKPYMNLDYRGLSPLIEAIQYCHEHVVEWLLKDWVDVNEEDTMGNVPLIYLANAICNEEHNPARLNILNILLRQDEININVKNAGSYTALHIFAQWGKFLCCQTLLKQGADYKKYEYTDFIPYAEFVLQNKCSAAKQWLEDVSPKDIQEKEHILRENIFEIFQSLVDMGKYNFAEDLVISSTWGKIFKEDNLLDFSLKKAMREYMDEVTDFDYKNYDVLMLALRKVLFLISIGADYRKEILTYQCSTFFLLISGVPNGIINNVGVDFAKSKYYQEFLKQYNEGRSRKMIGHRFALVHRTKVYQETFDVEGTYNLSGVLELKDAYNQFSQNYACNDNIKQILNRYLLPILDTPVKKAAFQDYVYASIMRQVSTTIESIFSTGWYNTNLNKPKTLEPILIPINTYYSVGSDVENHVEAFALFGEYLLTMNRGAGTAEPGIGIYRTNHDVSDKKEFLEIINRYMFTVNKHLNGVQWFKDLESVTRAKFLTKVDKKPQSSGNCGWASAKLMVYAAVYGCVYQFCKKQHYIKNSKSHETAVSVANEWYKSFTLFDRFYSLNEYLMNHGGPRLADRFSLEMTVRNLQNFFNDRKQQKPDDVKYDQEMLGMIYQKLMNKLMLEVFEKTSVSDKYSKEFEEIVCTGIAMNDWNPYCYAVDSENMQLIEQIIKLSDVPKVDRSGNTLLHYIARTGKYKICVWLIEKGFVTNEDLFLKDGNQSTAFHLAICSGHLDIAEFLLKTDSQLAVIPGLDACLDYACQYEMLESLEFIMRNGGTLPSKDQINNYSQNVQHALYKCQLSTWHLPILPAFKVSFGDRKGFETKEVKETKEATETKTAFEIKETKEATETKTVFEIKETKEATETREIIETEQMTFSPELYLDPIDESDDDDSESEFDETEPAPMFMEGTIKVESVAVADAASSRFRRAG